MQPFGEAAAEMVESATLPIGLATGGVPGAIGGAVRAGAQAIGKLTGYLAGQALGDIEAEERGTEDLYSTLTP